MIKVLLVITSLLVIGCGVKTPLANIEGISKKNAILIGSLSRDGGKAYYRAMSFKVFDLDDNYVTMVVNQGKENLKSLTNPFEFEDDFIYDNSKGSIFSISLPIGTYKLQEFYIGSGPTGYKSKFSRKIIVKAGDILYIGDIHSTPILKDNPFYDDIKMANGAKFIISNKLDRDYQVFQKMYKGKFFQKENITINLKEESFNLGNFNDSTNYHLILPPM